jgi:hypothetical protein
MIGQSRLRFYNEIKFLLTLANLCAYNSPGLQMGNCSLYECEDL